MACSEQEAAFSSNTAIPLLSGCLRSDHSDSRADDVAFKDVYPQRGNGISSLPALLPVLGQLQGVALKIQISICELSLGA